MLLRSGFLNADYRIPIFRSAMPVGNEKRPPPPARELPRWGHNVPPHGEFRKSKIEN